LHRRPFSPFSWQQLTGERVAGVEEEADKAMDAEDTPAHAPALPPVEADEEEAALIAAGQTATPWPPLPAAPESAAGSVMMAADDDDTPIKVLMLSILL
jgi:hypothetical protein